MEESPQYENEVRDLVNLLYVKGYRGQYSLHKTGEGRSLTQGLLSKCLKEIFQLTNWSENNFPVYELKTRAIYDDHLHYTFHIAYERSKGLQVREMDIRDTANNLSKHYKFSSNRTIPGAQAIVGLFPKKKSWQDPLKGKFRP